MESHSYALRIIQWLVVRGIINKVVHFPFAGVVKTFEFAIISNGAKDRQGGLWLHGWTEKAAIKDNGYITHVTFFLSLRRKDAWLRFAFHCEKF